MSYVFPFAGNALRAAAPYMPYVFRAAKYGSKAAKYGAGGAMLYNSFKRAPSRTYKLTSTIKRGGKVNKKGKRGFVASKNDGNTIQYSRFKKTRRKPDKALKAAIPEVFKEVREASIIATEGTQAIAQINTCWSGSDLRVFAPFQSNSLERFYVESAFMRTIYTNVTSTPVQMTLYDMVPKDDSGIGFGDPRNLIIQGLRAKYNSNTQYAVPYQNITESQAFTNKWKIINQKTLVLTPGEVHEHITSYNVNKYFENNESTEYYVDGAQNTRSLEWMKNFTIHHFCKIVGTPVTDGTNISCAQSKVICMSYRKLVYKRPQGIQGTKLIASQANVPKSNLTSEKTMNDDTMAVVTNTIVT